MRMAVRHGGEILVDQLLAHRVQRVFSVPGESFLAALDGLFARDIANVVCRHEGAAAMMAEAHGKLTGQPGVVFATRRSGRRERQQWRSCGNARFHADDSLRWPSQPRAPGPRRISGDRLRALLQPDCEVGCGNLQR